MIDGLGESFYKQFFVNLRRPSFISWERDATFSRDQGQDQESRLSGHLSLSGFRCFIMAPGELIIE